jgi:HK97 family phage prohead protease
MTETLYRSSFSVESTEGRTLSGIALPFDRPTLVQDLVRGRPGPPYLEAFSPTSTDVTLSHRDSFPVFEGHDHTSQPLGVVRFSVSEAERALLFESPLSKTRAADDVLELVNDGAMRSVSIGFRPVQAVRRMTAEGDLLYRTEVALRHLALAPTGYGQYEEAQVLSIRARVNGDPTHNEIYDAVQTAIQYSIFPDGLPEGVYVYVRDIADSWAVYCINGTEDGDRLYRVEYSIAEGGEVMLGTPEAVVVRYSPAEAEVARTSLATLQLRRRRLGY